jgi:hypothetical protein
MTSNYLIGPYCFDRPAKIAAYSAIVQTWLKPQLRHSGHTDDVWLQQDGALSLSLSSTRTHTHTHTLSLSLHSFVHDIVNKHFPGCLIGCGSMTSLAPLACPPFQPTNVQICMTTVSLYTMFSPTWFNISVSSSGSFTFVPARPPACLATLHKFLKLKLLKLKFHKIIGLKYNKILFGHWFSDTINSVWHYNILCKQCVIVAAQTISCWCC